MKINCLTEDKPILDGFAYLSGLTGKVQMPGKDYGIVAAIGKEWQEPFLGPIDQEVIDAGCAFMGAKSVRMSELLSQFLDVKTGYRKFVKDPDRADNLSRLRFTHFVGCSEYRLTRMLRTMLFITDLDPDKFSKDGAVRIEMPTAGLYPAMCTYVMGFLLHYHKETGLPLILYYMDEYSVRYLQVQVAYGNISPDNVFVYDATRG